MYESSAVKFHHAAHVLFRRNVVRHIAHASGFWLDCHNANNRVTCCVFADIASRTGAFHFESTYEKNQVDNNIICDVRTQKDVDGRDGMGGHGIQAEGTDRLLVAHNLILRCENAGFYANTVPQRIVDGRGDTVREHCLYNNIFAECRRSAIELANVHNHIDGNLYSRRPAGFLKIGTPVPDELLDLAAWREFHGWDKNGSLADLDIKIDPDKLTLSISGLDKVAEATSIGNITTDFWGHPVKGKKRLPGPFSDPGKINKKTGIDPRIKRKG